MLEEILFVKVLNIIRSAKNLQKDGRRQASEGKRRLPPPRKNTFAIVFLLNTIKTMASCLHSPSSYHITIEIRVSFLLYPASTTFTKSLRLNVFFFVFLRLLNLFQLYVGFVF